MSALLARGIVQDNVEAFQKLGFVIHPVKSVFIPTQKNRISCFFFDYWTASLWQLDFPIPKLHVHVRPFRTFYSKMRSMTIRETAQVTGLKVSSLPAVQFGELYYRHLEKNKVLALQTSKGHYDAPLYLSKDAKTDLSRWINNMDSSFKKIVPPNPDMTLTTDTSTKGWGRSKGFIFIIRS